MTSSGSAALADLTDCEHRWLIDPAATGQVVFWTSDAGIDSENPFGFGELVLIVIYPIPSFVWSHDLGAERVAGCPRRGGP